MPDTTIQSNVEITSSVTLDVIGLPKTLEQHVMGALQSDQELAQMFANWNRDFASALFPRALDANDPKDVLGIETPTPFIVARFGGKAGQLVYITQFSFWLYDSTNERYWRLDELATYLRNKFEGMKVPDILLSGDHKKIDDWRHEQALERTKERRPDLL